MPDHMKDIMKTLLIGATGTAGIACFLNFLDFIGFKALDSLTVTYMIVFVGLITYKAIQSSKIGIKNKIIEAIFGQGPFIVLIGLFALTRLFFDLTELSIGEESIAIMVAILIVGFAYRLYNDIQSDKNSTEQLGKK